MWPCAALWWVVDAVLSCQSANLVTYLNAMAQTFRVLVHGENYMLRFAHSSLGNSPYDDLDDDGEESDEQLGLSHAGVAGFYTTLTVSVANLVQLRSSVLQNLMDRLVKQQVIPILDNQARSYIRIERYESVSNSEEAHFNEGGFTFYPMSIWQQLLSIFSYHFRSLLCRIGLKNPIHRPAIIRALPVAGVEFSGHVLGSKRIH